MDFRVTGENGCNTNQGHIHFGSEGENGPVVVRLYPRDARKPETIEGRFTGVLAEGTITSDDLIDELEEEPLGALVDVIIDGLACVNVHSEQNPVGEIRGQIAPDDR